MTTDFRIPADEARLERVADMPFAEYRAAPGINASALKILTDRRGKTPRHFLAAMNGEQDRTESPALALGTLYHEYLLEPVTFATRYAVLDDELRRGLLEAALQAGSKAKGFSKNLTTYRDYKAQLEAKGGAILDEADVERLEAMRDALFQNERAREYFEAAGSRELSIFAPWKTTKGWLQLKGRVDLLAPGHAMDLKTAADAGREPFGRAADRFDYVLQAAMYLHLARESGACRDVDSFSFLVQETSRPYLAAVYDVPQQYLTWGRQRLHTALENVAHWSDKGYWPGYGHGDLELPAYVEKEMQG